MLRKVTPYFIKKAWIAFLITNKKKKLNKINVKFGKSVIIDLFTEIENYCSFCNYTQIQSSHIGAGTYISEYSCLLHTKIGKFCTIADNVRSGIGTHPSNTFVSIHPAFFSTIKQAGFTFTDENTFDEMPKVKGSNYVVEIGNDVWIGSGVRILDGIKIGNGAIIGTNAVVTKNIEPYSINVGVPAKKIKYRFSQEEIKFLEEFKWWNKDFIWLKENATQFTDIKKFIKKHNA